MKKLWYRKYYSFNYALENCDIVDFLSPYIWEGVKKIGIKINEERVHIALCSFVDYSKCFIGEKKNFEVAFCSRLEPDKNPILFLQAAKEIISKYPHVKFHILGEGTLVNEINSFIKSNRLENNINFNFYKNPPEIFKETSVFVSLQSNTNYPSQSLLEAMACGNAVIATNVGDTKLLLNDNNSLLINLDLKVLISSLEKMINHPDFAHVMGIKGRDFVIHNHTLEKFTEYFIGLLN